MVRGLPHIKRGNSFYEEQSISTDPFIDRTRKRGGHRPRTKIYGPRKGGRVSFPPLPRQRKKDQEPRTVHHDPLSKKHDQHHHGDRDRGRLATLGDTRTTHHEENEETKENEENDQ